MSLSPATAVRVDHPPERALLVFDGNCAVCREWVERWRAAAKGRMDFEPSTSAVIRFPELAAADPDTAVLLVESDGRVSRGAEAVFRSRRICGTGDWLAQGYERLPFFARGAEACYGFIARNRGALSLATRFLWAGHMERPSFATAVWFFLRALGVIYAIAFLSLWVQVGGLLGPDGILPAGDFLDAVAENEGISRWWFLPTLSWIFGGGWFLHVLCLVGLASGVLVALGRWQRWALVAAWVCYLSLVSVGQEFLSYQWDILLLESGFVAFFLAAPPRRVGWEAVSPSPIGVLLAHFLLFRLMFLSGIVKLTSGDPTWRSLDALKHHFETQPLPTWIGWAAHQLPDSILVAACAVMFAIEIVLPFFIWAPRRLRHFACAGFVALQVLILLTGNYTFFNLLTIALSLLILSDDRWPAWLRRRIHHAPRTPESRTGWVRILVPVAAWIILLNGAAKIPYSLSREWSWPKPVEAVLRTFEPLRIANNYGLFAVMTVERYEIALQGSMDGRRWESYEFSWKPGDLSRRPGFVAPHQPRLDWQMWFAALGDFRGNPWFLQMTHKILQGEESVLGLLDHDPFEGKAPRYMRAVIHQYEFSTPGELSEKDRWWKQGMPDIYMPSVSLSDFGEK